MSEVNFLSCQFRSRNIFKKNKLMSHLIQIKLRMGLFVEVRVNMSFICRKTIQNPFQIIKEKIRGTP